MKNLKVALFLPVLALAFFIGVPYASAATLTCVIDESAPSSLISCTGTGYFSGPDVPIYAGTSYSDCETEVQIGLCTSETPGDGHIVSCVPVESVGVGTYYLWASQDVCFMEWEEDTNNPHVVTEGAPPPPSSFTENIGAGMFGVIGDMGDYFGPVALIVVGFALGLYGIKVGYSYLISYVGVGKERRARRRRRT